MDRIYTSAEELARLSDVEQRIQLVTDNKSTILRLLKDLFVERPLISKIEFDFSDFRVEETGWVGSRELLVNVRPGGSTAASNVSFAVQISEGYAGQSLLASLDAVIVKTEPRWSTHEGAEWLIEEKMWEIASDPNGRVRPSFTDDLARLWGLTPKP